MLILQGILRAATTVGGGTNKKTGEITPQRNVLQVETVDRRGLVKMDTITMPSLDGYTGKSARSSTYRSAPGSWQCDDRLRVRTQRGCCVKPGASTAGAQRWAKRSGPLNLIHRNNSPKPVSMRVPEGLGTLPQGTLQASCPLSFLMGWRAANAQSTR